MVRIILPLLFNYQTHWCPADHEAKNNGVNNVLGEGSRRTRVTTSICQSYQLRSNFDSKSNFHLFLRFFNVFHPCENDLIVTVHSSKKLKVRRVSHNYEGKHWNPEIKSWNSEMASARVPRWLEDVSGCFMMSHVTVKPLLIFAGS